MCSRLAAVRTRCKLNRTVCVRPARGCWFGVSGANQPNTPVSRRGSPPKTAEEPRLTFPLVDHRSFANIRVAVTSYAVAVDLEESVLKNSNSSQFQVALQSLSSRSPASLQAPKLDQCRLELNLLLTSLWPSSEQSDPAGSVYHSRCTVY